MEAFGLLLDGFGTALQPLNLLVVFLGVLIGTIIGMLPGIGPINAIASFIGGTLSIFGLVLIAPLLARWAIRFGPAEYFALIVFTFTTISALTGRNFAKGLIATGVGLAIATVGLDLTNTARFAFGQFRLYDGLDFVVVTIGLFAVSEVFTLVEQTRGGEATVGKGGRVMITVKELVSTQVPRRSCSAPCWRSTWRPGRSSSPATPTSSGA